MLKSLTLPPIAHVNGNITLPGSKSISNRALLLAALANGTTRLNNLLLSDDVRHMLNALTALEIDYSLSEDNCSCIIQGNSGPFINDAFRKNRPLLLFLGNAGTALRPLAAVLSLNRCDITLTGELRMQERPIGDLVSALRQGGAEIAFLAQENYPPVRLQGGFDGGELSVSGRISSQFLTALLIAAPLARCDTFIKVHGELVSKPYIAITLRIMKLFGIKVIQENYQNFYIKSKQSYRSPQNYTIEGDASSASYFLAAAAIKGGKIKVNGIGQKSIQGDIGFAGVLEKMGAIVSIGKNYISCQRGELYGIDIDMNTMPDAAMTLAITALFANGATTIRNIGNWRVKESDRLTAMTTELRKIGAEVQEGADYLHIRPPKKFVAATVATYDDHRMAMCFSLVALSGTAVTIIDPDCTSKTFPDYFPQFMSISSLA